MYHHSNLNSPPTTTTKPLIVVIGAGVIGLTTALKIIELGGKYDVTILADHFPDDVPSTRYTSCWAGAHHVSLAKKDVRQQKMDRETFVTMWAMSGMGTDAEHCFLRIPQVEYYTDESVLKNNALEIMPGYRVLGKEELPPFANAAVAFTTLTIDVPIYLRYLLARFLATPGSRVLRHTLQHISQLSEGTYTQGRVPAAIIVCAGLGARTLGGVEDKDVYPLRGQTVLLRAPWIRFGRTFTGTREGENDVWTYIIPRRSGDVIVGGTKDADDWEPNPRPEATRSILERALELCPELSPNHSINPSTPSSVADIEALIQAVNCGLRPARHGGIRLESDVMETIRGVRIPVVYNYGHGGSGFLSSWGSASIAVELLEKALVK